MFVLFILSKLKQKKNIQKYGLVIPTFLFFVLIQDT